jgi:hypothetical protein
MKKTYSQILKEQYSKLYHEDLKIAEPKTQPVGQGKFDKKSMTPEKIKGKKIEEPSNKDNVPAGSTMKKPAIPIYKGFAGKQSDDEIKSLEDKMIGDQTDDNHPEREERNQLSTNKVPDFAKMEAAIKDFVNEIYSTVYEANKGMADAQAMDAGTHSAGPIEKPTMSDIKSESQDSEDAKAKVEEASGDDMPSQMPAKPSDKDQKLAEVRESLVRKQVYSCLNKFSRNEGAELSGTANVMAQDAGSNSMEIETKKIDTIKPPSSENMDEMEEGVELSGKTKTQETVKESTNIRQQVYDYLSKCYNRRS